MEARLITGAIWAMVINNTTPQVLYVANGYGANPTIYRSVDAGTTWKSLNAGVEFVQSIAIDRTNESHITVTFHDNCEAPRKAWCFSTSSDGGDSWTMFDGPTGPGTGGWVEGASITVLGPTSYIVGSTRGVWYTGNTGATWKQVATDTLYLTYSGGTTLANGSLVHAGAGHVLLSKAAPGLDPPFELAKGAVLDVVPNSAPASAFVTAGDLVFGGNGQPDKQPMYTAPSNDLLTWRRVAQDICDDTRNTCRGPAEMAYDPVHNVVYAANWGAGLWRYVIK